MSRLNFTPIKGPNIHGWVAVSNDATRVAEVIRSYTSDWFVFATLNGRVCKARSDEKRPMSFAAAMHDAREFLLGRITFEVHP